jgi:hypothetical protein
MLPVTRRNWKNHSLNKVACWHFLLFGDSFITPLLYILIFFFSQDINVYNLDSYIIFCQLALQEVQFREILLGLIGY